jgi:hypothetical protein
LAHDSGVLLLITRPDQVKASVILLTELGLARRDMQGFLLAYPIKSTDTGSSETSIVVNNFTLSMIDLA